MKYKVTSLILFLLTTVKIFAQYEIEFNETKGKLSLTDNFKPDFGRYDGYEISLYQGEAVNFIIQAPAFTPRLFFVSPKGETYKQSVDGQSNIASIITTIPESGEWLLYIVGDSASVGEYTFQYAFASSNALKYEGDSSFCSIINYITAHSKAYFLLFENSYDSNKPFIRLPNSIDSYLDEESGSYTSKMFESDILTDAELKFKFYTEEVRRCLDNNWTVKNVDWYNEKDFRVKEFQFIEVSTEIERLVNIRLYDFKNSREKYLHDYTLNIEIARRK